MRVLLLFVYVYLILYLIVNRRAREIVNKYVHKISSKLSKHINIRNLHIFYFFFCTSFRMENINFLYSIALWLSGFLSKFQVKLHSTPPPPPSQDLLQKEIRSSKSVYIPRWVAVETEDLICSDHWSVISLQILLSAWKTTAHNCHGARHTRHIVSLWQLSQQSGH